MTNKEQLISSLNNIKNKQPAVCIIGDVILDEYIIGYPERISREAPVLILETGDNYYRLGGAANAAINAAKLGAKVKLIGVAGDDKQAEILSNICTENNINLQLVKSPQRKTTLKTRILASNQSINNQSAGNASTQQVLRLDTLYKGGLLAETEQELINIINNIDEEFVLLSDYQLGVLNPNTIQALNNTGKKLLGDPSKDFNRLGKTYLITPNKPDTEKELDRNIDLNTQEDIKEIHQILQDRLPQQENILITKGAEGMTLFDTQVNKAFSIPAFNRAEVFDVTGAGDTVAGTLLVSLASGNNLLTSMILGNLGASIVVRRSGSATTDIQEMKNALESLYNNSNSIQVEEFNL